MSAETEARLAAALDELSLEISVHDLNALVKHVDLIPRSGRVYVNAVAGAGAEARIDTAAKLAQLGYQAVPHLAARRIVSAGALEDYLSQLVAKANVKEVLVIGGDIAEALGPYDSACDVISSGLLGKFGIGRVGIAGYPDGHPTIADATLAWALRTKLEACRAENIGAYVVTQFSFQASSIIDWCRALHEKHPELPIHAGIPGPAKLATLIRFAKICGVQSSVKKLMKNKKIGLDLLRRTAPWEQIEAIGQYRLETGRLVSPHIFTFGGMQEVVNWLEQVRASGDGKDVLKI